LFTNYHTEIHSLLPFSVFWIFISSRICSHCD
jgi:hypothetical protein